MHLCLSIISRAAFTPLMSVPLPANSVDLLFFIKKDNSLIAWETFVFFPSILENCSLIFFF